MSHSSKAAGVEPALSKVKQARSKLRPFYPQWVGPGRITPPSEHLMTGDIPDPWPTEADVDAVLEEFGGDAREAIRALLHDLAVLADEILAWVKRFCQ